MIEGQENFKGNEEHLKILLEAIQKKDISIWNEFVKKQGKDFKANLMLAELNKADLAHAELNGAKLLEAELNGANLGEAKLNDANLMLAELNKAVLAFAELNKADLGGAKLNDANLMEAELNKALLVGAELNKAKLRAAKLNGAVLLHAELNGADLVNANLEGADISHIKIDRKTKCRGIRISTAYGSQIVKRKIQDKDYLEEFWEMDLKHKIIYGVWWLFADCGRSFWRWGLWSIFFIFLFAFIYNSDHRSLNKLH